MKEFSQRCLASGSLARLASITLTVHQQLPLNIWMDDVLVLLSLSPLERFHIYSPGKFFESSPTDIFWHRLATSHGKRLTRISVHRMLIGLDAINEICKQCTFLEQLFVVVEPGSLVKCHTIPIKSIEVTTLH